MGVVLRHYVVPAADGDITTRWTGATGSEFRIKRDPAKVLGSAVARLTQPLCGKPSHEKDSGYRRSTQTRERRSPNGF